MRSVILVVVCLSALVLAACAPAAPAPAGERVVTQVVPVKETVLVPAAAQVVEKVITQTPNPAAAAGSQTAGSQAAGSQTAGSQPKRGGTLNMSLGPDFVNFDPYLDFEGKEFKPLVYETLIRFSDKGDFEPWLAESYETGKDGKSITVHLRKGVMFHTGREFKADDLIWSLERTKDTTLAISDRFKTYAGAEKQDDYTVKINYSEVTPGALDALARLYIFPKEAADKIKTVPVGTGPFKFQEWVPGDHLYLQRFDKYWRTGEPYLDKIVIKPIPDDQARTVNMLAGAIDFLGRVPLENVGLLQKTAGVSVIQQPPGFSFDAFLINITKPPFDKTLVRQAMNFTIDRDKMNKIAYYGSGVMTTLPWAPTSWAYPKDLENYYKFDLDKAKALLTEAGFPNGFDTEILIRGTSGVALNVAQVWQQDLAKVGVKLKITPMEQAAYLPKLTAGEFIIVSHATGEATIDPSGLFQGAACCRPFRNFFQITENKDWFPKYAAAIKAGDAEVDQAKRQASYREAIGILVEQGWTIPLGWRQFVFASKDYVKGARIDMDGLVWLNQAWMAK